MARLLKTPQLNCNDDVRGFTQTKFSGTEADGDRYYWFCSDLVCEFFPELVWRSKNVVFLVHDRPAMERVKIERNEQGSPEDPNGERNFLVEGCKTHFAAKASRVLDKLLTDRDAVYVGCEYDA
jgi:hypothetical protein